MQDRLSSRDQFPNRDLGDRHEDWHDRYDDFYDRHDDWHHGNWTGNAGDWWHHMWDEHTALMAFGVTMWGVNRAAYGFGYWGYENPYYTEPYAIGGNAVIDYSQPIAIEQAPDTAVPSSSDAPLPGMSDFDAARNAFSQGDYATALKLTDKSLRSLPNDPIIHEFRALVLFAQGRYQESAAGLYSVLAVGPGWDWTTLSSLYPTVDVYTKQLRSLEAYIRKNPQAFDARFVVAYHYLTTGNTDAAAMQFKELYKHSPQDPVIRQLLVMTAGEDAVQSSAPTDSLPTESTVVSAQELAGRWNAVGKGKTKYSLELAAGGDFVWTYAEGDKSQTVRGVYAVDGNVLAMEPESGGVMLAEVTQPQQEAFDFHLLGAPPGDLGLTFKKLR